MFEYRVKNITDIGTAWEDLPTKVGTLEEIKASAKQTGVFEVRYNKPRYVQGYYVPGQKGPKGIQQ